MTPSPRRTHAISAPSAIRRYSEQLRGRAQHKVLPPVPGLRHDHVGGLLLPVWRARVPLHKGVCPWEIQYLYSISSACLSTTSAAAANDRVACTGHDVGVRGRFNCWAPCPLRA